MKKNRAVIFNVFVLGLILLLAAAPASLEARKKKAKGLVFDDTNQNGLFDNGEKGIPGVVVSNQYDVVQTDKDGHFRLPVSKETIIFVTKPAGYDVPMNENNFPQFYYIHQPAGSPDGLKYPGIAPTGKLPRTLYFPLVKGKVEDTFSVIVMGDPQTRTAKEVEYFRDDVVAGLLGSGARFYMALGDIMYDHLDLNDKMDRLVGQIGIPVYHVQGNHDMNYRVPDHVHESETFKRIHGPDYYSFNYGKVHFVILNSIKYKGWDSEENKPGRYTGYVREQQLTWLKNDLSLVPEDHLVVLSMHIPVISGMYPESEANGVLNRAELFKILENRRHLLALAGHMHFVEYIEFTPKYGWNGEAVFPQLTAGAGCGTWWHGPLDPRGIPFGMGTDGSPNGHFLFTFKGNRYHYRFHPAAPVPNDQLRINSPTGILAPQDVKDGKIDINVNVFAGTPRSIVTYSLDGGPEISMKREVMDDPFFEKLVTENKDKYMEWMEPTPSAHIWVAPLPDNLQPGNHRLKITVTDHQGDVFTAYRLFEVSAL